jgi:hypothetical protein
MNTSDKLYIAMQNEAIKIAEERLSRPLTESLKEKIRLPIWSYTGLEMIFDSVRTIEIYDLEQYLSDLEK